MAHNKSKSKIYFKLKKKGKKIPVNNLKRRNTKIYKIS